MGVLFILEGLLEDEIAIFVVCNHHVLVARPGFDREASGIIRVQFSDWIRAHEEERLSFLVWRWYHWGWADNWLLWLSGSQMMAWLHNMSLDGLVCVRAVAGRIGVGETWKGVEVTRFDGLKYRLA